MTDVHGTTQRKSSPSQIVQIHSTVMSIAEKKIYEPRVEVVSELLLSPFVCDLFDQF